MIVSVLAVSALVALGVDSRALIEDSLECDIPGQVKKGICAEATGCVAYQKIVNDSALNLIERDDFIQRLQCGRYDGSKVCCPHSDSYQLGEYEDAAVCGQAAYGFRIRGGHIADIDEFPWTAMLLKEEKSSGSVYYHCGGVLIGRQFVLTAAHCIVQKSGEQDQLKYVRLREYNVYQDPDCVIDGNFNDCSDEKLDMKPRQLITHPEYKPGSQSRNHDIGIIQIDPVPAYSDFLLPICLPEKGLDQGDRSGRMHSVAGWGMTDFFNSKGSISWSPIKMKVALPFVSWEACRDVYKQLNLDLQRTQICAGGRKSRDSCAGDSGSALMHFDMKNAVWVLTGIASFGVKVCGQEGVPGVYTSVREHLSWIKDVTSKI